MINLKEIAYQRRLDVLEMVYSSKSGHIGGSMSCMDILVSLYYDVMDIEKIKNNNPDRDRFVLSKGHCAEALYAVLASCDFIEKEDLQTFTHFGGQLAEHPTKGIPGVEIATGALGHGLPAAVGMAIALKRDASPAHIYVLAGDGELAEGSNWEAMMSAAKYELDNMTFIIDRNCLQISGPTEDVMPLNNLVSKCESFGFQVAQVDGHDPAALSDTLKLRVMNAPVAVIAHTVKGKGSSIMENQADWHHLIPSDEQYKLIKADLQAAERQALHG